MERKTYQMPTEGSWYEERKFDMPESEMNMPENEEQPSPNRRKKRKKKRYLLKITIVLLLIGAALFVMSLSYFDIKTIKIEGNSSITAEQAIEDSGVKPGDNIFFLNKRQVAKKLHGKNPLYGDVKISKKLPDELVINISERIPAMTLPYGDKFVVLDKDGRVLDLTAAHPQVTEIGGITILQMDSGEVVEPKEKEKFERTKTLVKKAADSDIFFKKVTCEANEVVCNVYDRLYVKCTYDELVKIIDNGNLKGVLYDLYSKKIKRGTVKVENEQYCSFTPTFE